MVYEHHSGIDYSRFRRSNIYRIPQNSESTLVTEGEANDANIAALALGGMTRGITPVDLTAAYGTIANKRGFKQCYHV